MEPLTAFRFAWLQLNVFYKVTAQVFIFSYMPYMDLAFKQFQTMNGYQDYIYKEAFTQ